MATLLIIDDEEDICDVLEQTFKEEKGFAVLKADDGTSGLELIKSQRPDVILLDIKLYGALDGVEVLREIKKIHPQGKVVIITGFSDNTMEEEVKRIGVDAYLEKPFTPPQVVQVVKETLQEKWRRERG